jgi:hypothetical protein
MLEMRFVVQSFLCDSVKILFPFGIVMPTTMKHATESGKDFFIPHGKVIAQQEGIYAHFIVFFFLVIPCVKY